ncbi:uncharacterized protein LACBIDRAFT_190116 [Laccaria bicolor S238N-H82]|uniref:Predicted protein n=1 Tax=Laccaria bicolor (strain S238N-H82 / ATCC MYA-4686) TaxID=486041 RepID=B0D7U5_LACBS|nr:uncharacterized protein LACBIDRAFT_190116 [Laccaria bicolor S238N-H82]EDR09464.1 predicted protein [Laccaria bicolor S238N-H82]|eukprot:XP_001879813.1 predicted protein [Laccaria bicolor S238N-H82]
MTFLPFASSLATGWALLCIILLVVLYALRTLAASRIDFPPGPRPLPLIGNVHQLPTEHQAETFLDWGLKYGDVLHVHVFGHPMVILSSLQAARELLDKRSSIYSDRPRFVLMSELMGWRNASTHLRYGPRFRKHRRLMNDVFNQRATAQFQSLQEKETLTLLDGLLNSPTAYIDHFKRYAAALILKITYGYDVHSVDDRLVRLAERAGTLTVQGAGSPAATLVDFFPVMRHIPSWVPFASFKRRALETRKVVDDMMDIPYELVKANMRKGVAVPCYTSNLLEAQRNSQDGTLSFEDEEDIKGSAGTLLTAAEDTTVAFMHSFLLAMVLHPEIFKKAQEEMERVTGSQRLPTINDRPALPYLECVTKEVLRWNPLVPLGMPHRLMEDDYYRNFFIPTGTTVLANIFAILQDCPQPDIFWPERYLDDPTLLDPFTVIFGFGRRICPGRHLADTSAWSVMANLVAAFNISKALDQKGHEMTPKVEFCTGFVRHPKPFECSIKPRTDKLRALISQARADL